MNFGYNERQFAPSNNRAYPTTPSTFPQPMYGGQGNPADAQNAYNQGYFVNNPYAAQQPPQQYAAGNVAPQSGYPPRTAYQPADETNGLIQQFSNQDLGSPRPLRMSPQVGRPRTANSPAGYQQAPSNPVPPMPAQTANAEEELVRYPDMYSDNVHKRGKAAKELVNVFFRENIERARDRNLR